MAKATHIIYLEQLFAREAHELYQDETLLAEAFDLARKHASNPMLAELFERARRDTLDLASAIKEHLHGQPGKGHRSALRGILEEGNRRAQNLGDHHLVDAELIATMQRLLGYQLAGYENVANFARMLREDSLESVIERAIMHKRQTAKRLSQVALHQVHWRANWWAPEHTSAWDRVKTAFRRDWEQTKAHVGGATPPPGGQDASDTMAQITGRQEVAPAASFEADEPAFRYGYGAAQHYRDRDWGPGIEGELRSNYGGIWDETTREHVRAGWFYARPGEEENHRRSISLPANDAEYDRRIGDRELSLREQQLREEEHLRAEERLREEHLREREIRDARLREEAELELRDDRLAHDRMAEARLREGGSDLRQRAFEHDRQRDALHRDDLERRQFEHREAMSDRERRRKQDPPVF